MALNEHFNLTVGRLLSLVLNHPTLLQLSPETISFYGESGVHKGF
jgi:hypothetical protein